MRIPLALNEKIFSLIDRVTGESATICRACPSPLSKTLVIFEMTFLFKVLKEVLVIMIPSWKMSGFSNLAMA